MEGEEGITLWQEFVVDIIIVEKYIELLIIDCVTFYWIGGLEELVKCVEFKQRLLNI